MYYRPKVRLRKIYIYPQSLPKLVNHKCLWNLGKQWQVKYGSWSVDVLYSAGYTLLISDGLYPQLNYSLHLVTS